MPDFEPEIEREMNETLATLFVELAEETAPVLAENGEETERAKGSEEEGNKGRIKKIGT